MTVAMFERLVVSGGAPSPSSSPRVADAPASAEPPGAGRALAVIASIGRRRPGLGRAAGWRALAVIASIGRRCPTRSSSWGDLRCPSCGAAVDATKCPERIETTLIRTVAHLGMWDKKFPRQNLVAFLGMLALATSLPSEFQSSANTNLASLHSKCGMDASCYFNSTVDLDLPQPFNNLINTTRIGEIKKSCACVLDDVEDYISYLKFVDTNCDQPIVTVYSPASIRNRTLKALRYSQSNSKSTFPTTLEVDTDENFFVPGTPSYNVSTIR